MVEITNMMEHRAQYRDGIRAQQLFMEEIRKAAPRRGTSIALYSGDNPDLGILLGAPEHIMIPKHFDPKAVQEALEQMDIDASDPQGEGEGDRIYFGERTILVLPQTDKAYEQLPESYSAIIAPASVEDKKTHQVMQPYTEQLEEGGIYLCRTEVTTKNLEELARGQLLRQGSDGHSDVFYEHKLLRKPVQKI